MLVRGACAEHLRSLLFKLTETGVGIDVYKRQRFDCTPEDVERRWRAYFDLDTDYEAIPVSYTHLAVGFPAAGRKRRAQAALPVDHAVAGHVRRRRAQGIPPLGMIKCSICKSPFY